MSDRFSKPPNAWGCVAIATEDQTDPPVVMLEAECRIGKRSFVSHSFASFFAAVSFVSDQYSSSACVSVITKRALTSPVPGVTKCPRGG